MKHLKYNQLNIDDVLFEGDELHRFCISKLKSNDLKPWEIACYNFIIEWLSDKDEVLVKTSGSTGAPKQIRIPKQFMINSAKATEKALKFQEGETALLALSPEFIAGKMMIVRAMVSGLKLLTAEPSGNPIQHIEKNIDFTALVPYQVITILKEAKEAEKLRNIKKIIIGGGPVDDKLIQKLAAFPNEIYATYGMTETCTHIALRRINGSHPDRCFKTLPDIKINLDSKSCLVIDAPHLNNEVLKTNDLATLISESEFSIIGRYDHVINSGGIKVSPETIEAKLAQIIKENFIISSVPDDKLGEKLILLIESEQYNLNSLFQLWQKIEEVLPRYEIPKRINFIEHMAYTQTGKIDRIRMKEISAEV